jgi:Flp pilus assembly CpaE family ATPase
VPVIALVSAKGSPGVTTAAAALTAAASLVGDALLVELDPSGGDVQILTGLEEEPGVVLAAAELRRNVSARAVEDHVSIAPPEVPALLAPTAELMASSVIASVIDRWRPALRAYGGTVVVDAGRWDAAQATARRVTVGDLVVVVCRPSVASVEHARHIVDRLRAAARRPVVALVVGTRPYAPGTPVVSGRCGRRG